MRPTPNKQFPADSISLSDGQARIQDLANQVSDIAQMISRLNQPAPNSEIAPAEKMDAPTLRRMLAARRARAEFFTNGLFADPAWDILLDLLMAKLSYQRISVTSLCVASNVPATTALRWIKILEKEDLVIRRADPLDGRRIFVELTEKAEQALDRFFVSINLGFVIR